MFYEAMHPGWRSLLPEAEELLDRIEASLPLEYVPASDLVMRAFESAPEEVRVVIVGQDPYPTAGHAIGLSFAINQGVALPRSLNNMMKELRSDLSDEYASGQLTAGGDLTRWVSQGVMLLNRELTLPGHRLWQEFTDAALRALVQQLTGRLVVILWGNHAAKAEPAVAGAVVLRSAHPSPLSASRGFFGSRPYSKANDALESLGLARINWSC
ncbi:MAG: uracil-DNA glycosylase [Actinomycetales bacterium]|nr:uracil-DNA glycosylase [Actinomycetales bacterium]